MMTKSFEGFANTLLATAEIDTVWKHMAKLSNNYGFSNCTLTIAKKTSNGFQTEYLASDLPKTFCDDYANEGLILDDPFLQFSCRSLSTQKIISMDPTDFPRATPKHRIFLDIVTQSGAPNGLGVPVRTSGFNFFGGWLFSSIDTGDRFDLLCQEHQEEAQLASVMAYERMAAIKLGITEKFSPLSQREKECLLWLCAGHRTSMIAERLSISRSAVNLYITNAKYKLGAKTREQAIARAIQSGQIVI